MQRKHDVTADCDDLRHLRSHRRPQETLQLTWNVTEYIYSSTGQESNTFSNLSAYITHNAASPQSDITRVKSSEKPAASSGDTKYLKHFNNQH